MTPSQPTSARLERHLIETQPVDQLLSSLIDWSELEVRGWDPDRQVFAPHQDDAVFGFALCSTDNCEQAANYPGLVLCRRCQGLWEATTPGVSFEEFCRTAPARTQPRAGELCRVCRTPGHERPVRGRGLCTTCSSVARDRGQTVSAYVAGDEHFAPAEPRPSFGPCVAGTCQRWAHRGDPAICESHERTWVADGRPTGSALGDWCARARTLDVGSQAVVLGGLAGRARLEVLYGLQEAARLERPTRVKDLQAAVGALRAQGAQSVLDASDRGITRDGRSFLVFVRDRVSLGLTTPADEMNKDRWDLRVFGRASGWVHFEHLAQDWLRQGAKAWVWERMPTSEHPARLDQVIHYLGLFSESLRSHRTDRGGNPRALGRADVVAFCNDLAHLEAAGRLSRFVRRRALGDTDQFLREARAMGLTRGSAPMAGLPEDVVLAPTDRLRPQDSRSGDEVGRSLPQVVLDQLLAPASLDRLEEMFDPDTRAMVELQAWVGRRTGELCRLSWGCLVTEEVLDETGQVATAPVLVHDMPKVGVRGYRLPIDEDAAGIIQAQQARVRRRYPDTPDARLVLFPALVRNPRGVKPFNPITLADRLRTWVADLPRLIGPGGGEYERAGICPYSFRHTYAQRLADNGTPVEVLAELLGHSRLSTTQGYYRVTHKRKRAAIDQLAAFQVNARAERARPAVERLLESEHLRDAVGAVAVPFGICREPTNVKAHGQACPFRHQCFGCTHFRTDPSFLPELGTHLRRLLADKERLRAAEPQLEEWARKAAIPSDAEIGAVRGLIDRCENLLGELDETERSATEDAIGVLRRQRAQLATTVPVRFRGVIGPSTPKLFPNVRREQEGRTDEV